MPERECWRLPGSVAVGEGFANVFATLGRPAPLGELSCAGHRLSDPADPIAASRCGMRHSQAVRFRRLALP